MFQYHHNQLYPFIKQQHHEILRKNKVQHCIENSCIFSFISAQNQTNNCTDATTNIKEAQQNVLRRKFIISFEDQPFFPIAISIDNIEKPKISTNEEEIWYPKLSKSEQSAYNKDVSRLRIVVKPKTKSTQHASISEIHALIRNSHRIRRRMLSQNQDTDFTKKVFQYQEIFHEEAVRILSYIQFFSFDHKIIFLSSFFFFFVVIYLNCFNFQDHFRSNQIGLLLVSLLLQLHCEYSLLKNKLCSLEELEDEARLLLNDIIGKHSVHQQDQVNRCVLYIYIYCGFLINLFLYLDE